MKFNFSTLTNLSIEGISPTVTGNLPSGEKVEVTRYLHGWYVYLKITVDGVIYHDCEISQDERRQVDILRESAFNNRINQQDAKRTKIIENARFFLTPELK